MNRIICLMLLLVAVSACKGQKHSQEINKPSPEQTGGDESIVVPPTIEDLTSYFGLSKEQTVAQAIALITSVTGEKKVNGKVLQIAKSEVVKQSDEEGKFTVKVEGTIDGKKFSAKEYPFEGFAVTVVEQSPPTLEDIKAYLGISGNETVAQVIALITNATDEKTVNGRVMRITKGVVTLKNERLGKLTVKIEGTIGGKPFSETYSFDGLTKKPEDHHIATRAHVKWKSEFDKSPESTTIAFDELYRLKQPAKFTVEYLSQWVGFYSSDVDGTVYHFTEEDLKKTQISDVSYDNIAKKISFVITYNGIKGATSAKERPSLSFDHNLFYKRKVSLLKEETKNFYMQGVYKNLDVFINKFARVQGDDSNEYALMYVENSKNSNVHSNSISCKLSLAPIKDGDNILAEFDFIFEGFKPLSDLKEEWGLATSADLGEAMGKKFKKLSDGNVLEQVQKYPISIWIKLAQMYISRDKKFVMLAWDKDRMNGQEVDALIAQSARVLQTGDILLLQPIFELRTAKKEGNRLTLEVAFTSANEFGLEGVVTTFTVTLH